MRTLIDEFGLAIVEAIAALIILSVINTIICLTTDNVPTSPLSHMIYKLFMDIIGG